jgi:hypothetical protein
MKEKAGFAEGAEGVDGMSREKQLQGLGDAEVKLRRCYQELAGG